MALEREQIEVLSQGNPVPLSTPTTPIPEATTTGGAPVPPAGKRRFSPRLWLSAVVLLILVLLATAAYVVDAIWLVPQATITIVPATSTMSRSVTVDAVLVSPTASQAKVTVYTASSKRESAMHATSGVGHQLAVQATGQLWFYNIANYEITIPQGTTFTGSDGVSVRTDAPAYVPAGNPPQQVGNTSVSAHAMLPGASGNIGALDINSALQGNYNGIEVKNQAAFSGGQDEQTYPVVSKSDITSAAGPLVTSLTQAAQAVLQAQLGKSEQFLTPQASCQPTVRANPAAGQPGQQVTVAVQVTCHRDAFDQQQLTGLAASRFSRQAMAQLGSGYAPVGSPTTGRVQVIVINESLGHFTLIVPVSGRFVYQFSRSLLESLPGHLVNMSSSAASSLLLNTPGIAQASIQLSGWNNGMLPAEPTRIHVILMAPRSA